MPKAKSSRAIGCLQKSEISNIKQTKNVLEATLAI